MSASRGHHKELAEPATCFDARAITLAKVPYSLQIAVLAQEILSRW
jgi:hypothetical protein